MRREEIEEKLEQILRDDDRYAREAYDFVGEALEFTMQLLKKPDKGPDRHVSGQELLDGVRQFALKQYGPMTKEVLAHWGVRRCEDFGEIVFNLVEKQVLGKTDKDTRADFASGYDFDDAFVKPFAPQRRRHAHSRGASEERARRKN